MSTAPERARGLPFSYEFGGFRVSLDSFPFHESEYLAAFRKECRQVPELRLTIRDVPLLPFPTDVEIAAYGESRCLDGSGRKLRVCRTEHTDAILYRVTELGPGELLAEIIREAAPNLGSHLILRWLDLPNHFLERDALFLHASMLRWKNRAILFSGRKQIGKSTQAELWRSHRGAEVLNGDRALLRRVNGVWTAFGSPFCGTSGICVNAQLPVAAIVLLKQGPENRVAPADLKMAYTAFLSGCSYDPGNWRAIERVMSLTEQIHRELPVLQLSYTPDEGAVLCLEQALKEAGIDG